jgi:hypothetical protein
MKMSQKKLQHNFDKNPHLAADQAFLRVHFEMTKTMDLIDDMHETLSQALKQGFTQGASQGKNKGFSSRCVRQRNARGEIADRLKILQVLASDDPSLRSAV